MRAGGCQRHGQEHAVLGVRLPARCDAGQRELGAGQAGRQQGYPRGAQPRHERAHRDRAQGAHDAGRRPLASHHLRVAHRRAQRAARGGQGGASLQPRKPGRATLEVRGLRLWRGSGGHERAGHRDRRKPTRPRDAEAQERRHPGHQGPGAVRTLSGRGAAGQPHRALAPVGPAGARRPARGAGGYAEQSTRTATTSRWWWSTSTTTTGRCSTRSWIA